MSVGNHNHNHVSLSVLIAQVHNYIQQQQDVLRQPHTMQEELNAKYKMTDAKILLLRLSGDLPS
jgi:hypothetical protein